MAYERHTYAFDARNSFRDTAWLASHNESMAFRENLRRLMEARGFTNADLGRALGITGQAVSQWLQPGGTLPRGSRLARIADALGVSVSTLTAEHYGFSEDTGGFASPPGPPPEYSRLPEQVQALADALAQLGITLPAHAVTRHAQAALAQATRMDRALPFAERARLAAEAKAADIARSIA
jgi:transcriptional regulator with XRE-family HTH domain